MTRITRAQALTNQLEKRTGRFAARDARASLVAERRENAKLVLCMCGQMSTTHIAQDGLRRTDCCGAH